MRDWSECDGELLAAIGPVVAALFEIVPADQIMIVGAQCRDLLSWRFESDAPKRSTSDTDVAVALKDWAQFAEIRQRFSATGSTGHRFIIGDVPTDILPFGGVEAPLGTSAPHSDALNVHGFTDVYQRSDRLRLPDGNHVRIPRPEGYAVLKTHAWLDRSARNEYRDGPDLALAVHWYADDLDRIYANENTWALELHDFDIRQAAGALLGGDMRDLLSPGELTTLATRVNHADRDLLAHYFALGGPHWPGTDVKLRPIVDALFDRFSF